MAPEPKNVLIIGAGIIGSTTAYYLTRHPSYSPERHTITIIEANDVASGASGKAGGLLALWAYPRCLVGLSYRLHAELAKEHGGEEKWGYRVVGCGSVGLKGRKLQGEERVLRKEKVTGEGHSGGGVLKGPHDESIAGKEGAVPNDKINGSGTENGKVSLQKLNTDSFAHLKEAGWPEDLDWIAPECALSYEAMGSEGDTAQVHPYQFTTSMLELAKERGVKIVYGSVTDIESNINDKEKNKSVHYTDKQTNHLHTLSGITDVVITAGPWTSQILPSAPISNTRAHSVTIRPSRPVSAHCLFTDLELPPTFTSISKVFGKRKSGKARHVTPEIYARPNNEIYACGEGDHLVPLPKSTAEVAVDDSRCQDIIESCAAFSDEMRDGDVLVRQACYLPVVEGGGGGGGPLVGSTGTKGVWIAAGHTCWGICNSAATGKVMSEFVFDGRAESADVRSLDPRRWGC